MRCFNCGRELPEDSNFCQFCGTKLATLNSKPGTPEMNAGNAMSSDEKSPENKSPATASPAFNWKTANKKIDGSSVTVAKIAAVIIGTSISCFSWSTFLQALLIAVVLGLLMCRVLKMKGEELPICYLVIAQASTFFIDPDMIWNLRDLRYIVFNEITTPIYIASLVELLFCAAQIILACVFYRTKSKKHLTVLLIFETSYLISYIAAGCLYIIEGSSQACVAVMHSVWLGLAIYLIIRYLTGTGYYKDKLHRR